MSIRTQRSKGLRVRYLSYGLLHSGYYVTIVTTIYFKKGSITDTVLHIHRGLYFSDLRFYVDTRNRVMYLSWKTLCDVRIKHEIPP